MPLHLDPASLGAHLGRMVPGTLKGHIAALTGRPGIIDNVQALRTFQLDQNNLSKDVADHFRNREAWAGNGRGNVGGGNLPNLDEFTELTGSVSSILPPDTKGLPHQLFYVQVGGVQSGPGLNDGGLVGRRIEVANDTQYGSAVTNLQVGDKVTLKGILVANDSVIHWTHSLDGNPGGFIQDHGQTFQ